MILSPAEREIVEALFDKPGDFKIVNVTPEKTYQLGTINVSNQSPSRPLAIPANESSSFYNLKDNKDIIDQIQPCTK